jgi:opacity protein-like surface antigen
METTTIRNRLNLLLSKKRAIGIGIILLMTAHLCTAQNNWRTEIRGGVNFPVKDFGVTKLKTGFGFEGTLTYHFFPQIGIYGGWSSNKFAADNADLNFKETGYSFGLQFIQYIGTSRMNYTIKGGGTYNHVEAENSNGNIILDTRHGVGWQLGAGVTISVGERWLLLPEIRYRSLSRDIKIGTENTTANLNYLSVGLGLSFSF